MRKIFWRWYRQKEIQGEMKRLLMRQRIDREEMDHRHRKEQLELELKIYIRWS